MQQKRISVEDANLLKQSCTTESSGSYVDYRGLRYPRMLKISEVWRKSKQIFCEDRFVEVDIHWGM